MLTTEVIARTAHRRVPPRRLVRGLLVIALTATSLLVANPGAQAASDTAAAPPSCPDVTTIRRGRYSGETCVEGWYDEIWYQGRRHTFVTGSNRQIYYIWQRYQGDQVWSGWRSLGGEGHSAPFADPNGVNIYLEVLGRGNRWYCKTYAPASSWTPWRGC